MSLGKIRGFMLCIQSAYLLINDRVFETYRNSETCLTNVIEQHLMLKNPFLITFTEKFFFLPISCQMTLVTQLVHSSREDYEHL